MEKIFHLKPVAMTKERMLELEERGLIYLLGPGKHFVPGIEEGTGSVKPLYISDIAAGAHKIIAITKNVTTPKGFGCHCDNEEFLLIGDPGSKKLYLLMALDPEELMMRKYAEGTLSDEDFILLDCRFNDVECSFFTMLKTTAHTEFTAAGEGIPPSFYVTEPASMITHYDEYAFELEL